jgi:CheY-like chemotaxis protein
VVHLLTTACRVVGAMVLRPAAALGVVLLFAGTGCSIRGMAIDSIGSALAGGGDVFAAEDDPELVRAATPFALKTIEGLIAQRPRNIDLLLADVVMPGMSGPELAPQLLATRGAMAVLFMSGYADEVVSREGQTVDSMIHKPFTPRVLLDSVRRALQ